MNEYFIFDAHCDTMSELLLSKEELKTNNRHLSLDKMEQYRGYIQVFAAWIDEKKPNSLSEALSIIDYFYQEIEKNADKIHLITDYDSLMYALKNNKMGALLSVEDARAICGSLANLRMLYRLGVRIMTLAWNHNNDVTDGTLSKEGKGLTEFGKQVVAQMNQLGMIIDVSHMTQKGFWEVIALSQKPIIATHSNAYSICPHPRNLTDEQIQTMIQSNSMIGLNIYPLFLNNSPKATVTDIIRHVEHFLSLGAENHLGMGTDFDGVPILPDEIQHAGELYKLFDEMKKLGFGDEIIKKITHQNLITFLEKNLL